MGRLGVVRLDITLDMNYPLVSHGLLLTGVILAPLPIITDVRVGVVFTSGEFSMWGNTRGFPWRCLGRPRRVSMSAPVILSLSSDVTKRSSDSSLSA